MPSTILFQRRLLNLAVILALMLGGLPVIGARPALAAPTAKNTSVVHSASSERVRFFIGFPSSW